MNHDVVPFDTFINGRDSVVGNIAYCMLKYDRYVRVIVSYKSG